MARRRQVTGRRDDRWSPDESYFLHCDGITKVWDTDILIEGGPLVARSLWDSLRTPTWKLWARGRPGLGPSWQAPAGAETFDFPPGPTPTSVQIDRFAAAHPRAFAAIESELAIWLALVEQRKAELADFRFKANRYRLDPVKVPDVHEGDDVESADLADVLEDVAVADDVMRRTDLDPEAAGGPEEVRGSVGRRNETAPVIPIRRNRHGSADVPYS